MLDSHVSCQLVFTYRLKVALFTAILGECLIVGVKLHNVPSEMIFSREILLTVLAREPDAEVNILLVVLHLVFALK